MTRTVSLPPAAPGALTWEEVARLCGALWPRLRDCRLDLTMAEAAEALGLPSNRGLQRHLVRLGLPPFRLLRDWTYIVALLERASPDHPILASHPAVRGRDPAPYYRFIRRVTGWTWRELLRLGPGWARGAALLAWAPFMRHPHADESLVILQSSPEEGHQQRIA